MKFYSLNNHHHTSDFTHAVMAGICPDAGLYFPKTFPVLHRKEISSLPNASLNEIAFMVLQKWIGDEFDTVTLFNIVKEAFNYRIPLRKVGKYYVLELFHGPTMAFKDIAVRVLAQIMKQILLKKNKKITVLTATSGDTGGSVAQGFGGVDNINVIVLYPKGKVSRLQEEQITRVNPNVFPVEVEGVFDDCQSLVKTALHDKTLKKYNFTTANSINVGRLVPQIIYYAYVYSKLINDNIEFVIPSGNTGNLTSCLFGYRMGIPVTSVIAACNSNDAVVDYQKTGKYSPKKTVSTLSNAMDIGSPNNFCRILNVFGNNHPEFCRMIKTASITDGKTINTIKNVYAKYGYLLDPHTAVAWSAADELADPKKTTVIISTASPIKFADEIRKSTGIRIDNSGELKKLREKSVRKYTIKGKYPEFKKSLLSFLN